MQWVLFAAKADDNDDVSVIPIRIGPLPSTIRRVDGGAALETGSPADWPPVHQ